VERAAAHFFFETLHELLSRLYSQSALANSPVSLLTRSTQIDSLAPERSLLR
jgi:hypothetical protein